MCLSMFSAKNYTLRGSHTQLCARLSGTWKIKYTRASEVKGSIKALCDSIEPFEWQVQRGHLLVSSQWQAPPDPISLSHVSGTGNCASGPALFLLISSLLFLTHHCPQAFVLLWVQLPTPDALQIVSFTAFWELRVTRRLYIFDCWWRGEFPRCFFCSSEGFVY